MSSQRRVPVTQVGRRGDVGGVVIGSQERQNLRIDTILQQACCNGVLRLANRNLSEIPQEIFHLHATDYKDKRWWEEQQLTVFDISNNAISNIPVPQSGERGVDALSAFASLRLINGAYNQLRQFPLPLLIACATTLTKLDLSHNQLDGNGLPFAAGGPSSMTATTMMPSLLELDLSHNQLDSLSCIARQCPMLEKLNVAKNKIRLWVEDDAVGISLRHLNVSENMLTALCWGSNNNRGASAPNQDVAMRTTMLLGAKFPNLLHLDANRNQLTCAGIDGGPGARVSGPPLPTTMVTANFKNNALGQWPNFSCGGGLVVLAALKELYLGRNQLPTPPPNAVGTVLAPLSSLEMLDISDNRIHDVSFLLPLSCSLSRLDAQNNDLTTLPPDLGFFKKLTSVLLDGNPLKAIRRDVIAKGTHELMAFLRDRATAATSSSLAGQQVVPAIRPLDHGLMERAASGVPQHGRGVSTQKVDDRPFATALNTAVVSEETRLVDGACVRVGERSGTVWDLSFRQGTTTGRVGMGAGGVGGGARRLPLSGVSSIRDGPAVGGGLSTLLPTAFDTSLNFAELHASTEGKFRDGVQTINLSGQRDIQTIGLDVLELFPKLREVNCSGCASLTTFTAAMRGAAALRLPPLVALDLSGCGVQSLPAGEGRGTASTIDPAFEAFARHQVPLARLNIASNAHLRSLPESIVLLAPTLQVLRLDNNASLGGANSLQTWGTLGQLSNLVELSIARCSITEMPADGGDPSRRDFGANGFCESSWPRLQSLDISVNDLTTIPFTIGRMKHHLKTLNVEGNRVRWLRHDTLAKGTVCLLEYLEGRIPLV